MIQPLISFIIVTYQAEENLEGCIQSILNQTYRNFEIIVIDGASTDGTLEIIKSYSGNISYFVSEPDKGIYDAMNKGLARTKGDFICFLGADDILNDNLHIACKHFNNPNTIYYGNVRFKHSGLIFDGSFSKWKIIIKNICHQAIFYPKSVFENYSYQIRFKYLADHYLNLQLFADNQFRFCYLPYEFCVYNERGTSSLNYDPQFIKEKLGFIKDNFGIQYFIYALIRKTFSKYFLRKEYYKL